VENQTLLTTGAGSWFCLSGDKVGAGLRLRADGHEWAKRQLDKRGIGYEALDNGFLSCDQPEKLQEIRDSLGPEQIDRVFRKWLKRIPLPLQPEDRRDGYDWDLSICWWPICSASAQLNIQPAG